jgi:hypothetical protein
MTSRRLIVAMFTTTALTAAVGVAYAADNGSHPTPSPGGSHRGFVGNGPFGRGPAGAFAGGPRGIGLGGPGGGIGAIEHGQFVVTKPGGGTQTEAIQSGTATAVSTSSITVKSTDGYTHDYVINTSTHQLTGCSSSTLASGDDVTVIASVQDSTDTALNISRRMAFTPPKAGSTPSPRPTSSGSTAPGAGGLCGGGFAPGPGGHFGPDGPGHIPPSNRPSGVPSQPSGFPTGASSF